MSEFIENLVAEPNENERNALIVCYLLFAAGLLGVFPAPIIGVVIDHVRLDRVGPTARSHHRWLLRTFWWTLGWGVVLGLLHVTFILIPLAWLGSAILGVWYLYRLVRGALRLADRLPMPTP